MDTVIIAIVLKTYKNESGHPPSVAGSTVINFSKSKRIKQMSSAICNENLLEWLVLLTLIFKN